MTDFERRLRAALTAADEPPPSGLLEGIRRRHRRHVMQVRAACATAAVIAFATPLAFGVVLAPTGTGPAGPRPARPATVPSAVPSAAPTAMPGTVLRDCQSNNNGTLGSNWKAHSVHAGPVWFIYERPSHPSSGRLRSGKLVSSAMVIAVSNARTAVVTADPATGGRFRFLAAFSGGPDAYTLADGAPGLTLIGCPAGPAGTGIPQSYAPGLTMFWQGYVTTLRGCIPLEVRAPPAKQPIRVTVPAAGGGCASS